MKSSKKGSPKAQAKETQSSSEQTQPARDWWDEAGLDTAFVVRPKNVAPLPSFDLVERTAAFGEEIVKFSKRIPPSGTNKALIGQLVEAATNIGGNYNQAHEGPSNQALVHLISRSVEEAKETKRLLRKVADSEPQLATEARVLYREANELLQIFSSM